ncbi:MAG: arsenate reductase ArsC [Hyphomicrobiaceae bacterium]
MINVLVLCTANSARSILAEAILNKLGKGRFRAFSAGSHPRGTPNRLALELLKAKGHPTGALRSKSWQVFAEPGAPRMHIVITVCDAAAAETCPVWEGAPVSVHWGIADPAGVAGGLPAERDAFRRAYARLEECIREMVALPVEKMDRDALQEALERIGEHGTNA